VSLPGSCFLYPLTRLSCLCCPLWKTRGYRHARGDSEVLPLLLRDPDYIPHRCCPYKVFHITLLSPNLHGPPEADFPSNNCCRRCYVDDRISKKTRARGYPYTKDIVQVLAAIFSCTPVSGFWDFSLPSQCISGHYYYLGVAIPNIVTDIVLLIIPLPYIWKLRINGLQKVAVSGIFVLGGL
jgi:hypothetical protein